GARRWCGGDKQITLSMSRTCATGVTHVPALHTCPPVAQMASVSLRRIRPIGPTGPMRQSHTPPAIPSHLAGRRGKADGAGGLQRPPGGVLALAVRRAVGHHGEWGAYSLTGESSPAPGPRTGAARASALSGACRTMSRTRVPAPGAARLAAWGLV